MTCVEGDHEFSFYPYATPPNLVTWTMTIGLILVAFLMAYWAHISFAPLSVAGLFR